IRRAILADSKGKHASRDVSALRDSGAGARRALEPCHDTRRRVHLAAVVVEARPAIVAEILDRHTDGLDHVADEPALRPGRDDEGSEDRCRGEKTCHVACSEFWEVWAATGSGLPPRC